MSLFENKKQNKYPTYNYVLNINYFLNINYLNAIVI